MVMQTAAEHIARVSLELGGKSANVVFDDVDVDTCVDEAPCGRCSTTRARTAARGRACSCSVPPTTSSSNGSRRRPTRSRSVSRSDEATADGTADLLRVSGRPPSTTWPDRASTEGARHVTGGEVPDEPGFFMRPAVLADVDNASRVAQEEIFGPVVSIVPFDTEDGGDPHGERLAVRAVGFDLDPGLGRAIRVSKAIRTGNLSVNSSSSVHTEAPFGGYKQSGMGREMGMHAVNLFTEVKNIYFSEE